MPQQRVYVPGLPGEQSVYWDVDVEGGGGVQVLLDPQKGCKAGHEHRAVKVPRVSGGDGPKARALLAAGTGFSDDLIELRETA